MKKEGDIKRRYQHPDAVSYTPENEDGLMLLIRPSFFCKYTGHLLRCLVKSVHPCTLLTASFSIAETSLLIEPATSVPLLKNPQRIKDTPAVNLCSRLVSIPSICKSAVRECARMYIPEQWYPCRY